MKDLGSWYDPAKVQSLQISFAMDERPNDQSKTTNN